MERFLEVAIRCDGMLPVEVYQEVFEAGRRGGLIVEVGTALGASTVALALGLKESSRPGRVISFDPMTGGPRRDISSTGDRLARVRSNLKYFDVDHLVEVVTSDLPSALASIPPGPISVLMLDADGRIDRDLIAIYDRVEPNGTVVVDDVADMVRLTRTGINTCKVDAKMRLTKLLLDILKIDGAVSSGRNVCHTYFGHKPDDFAGGIDPKRMLDAYREIVFSTAQFKPSSTLRKHAARWIRAAAPGLAEQARATYRRILTA